MSVSQVKKRFAEFESYLRNDKEGLRRLKLLKDDVNVLRTSLAAAVEAKELAETIKDAARERADKAEAQATAHDNQRAAMEGEIMALKGRLAIITDTLQKLQDDRIKERSEPADEEAAFKRMMRELSLHMEHCPQSLRTGGKIPSDTMWFNRSDFGGGWSHKVIWALGASVAALVALNGQIVVFTDETIGTMKRKGRMHSAVRTHIRWFKRNIRKEGVDQMWESLTDAQREESERAGMVEDTASVIYGDNPETIEF
jgi:hypothetical protein